MKRDFKSIEQRVTALGIQPLHGNSTIPESVLSLEEQFQYKLPTTFSKFIQKHAGSDFPDRDIIVRPVRVPPSEVSREGILRFSYFLSIDDMLMKLKLLMGRMPESMLPFACDYMGNNLIGCSGEHEDEVYFWSFMHEPAPEDYTDQGLPVPDDIWFQNLTLVSKTFAEFIEKLEVRE